MKQYKTLKDLPGIKVGTLGTVDGRNVNFKPTERNDFYAQTVFAEDFVKKYPDFFEEVIELEKLFTIEDMDDAYHAPTIHGSFKDYIEYSFPQHIDQLKHLK